MDKYTQLACHVIDSEKKNLNTCENCVLSLIGTEAPIEVSIVRSVRCGPEELEGLIDMKSLSEESVEDCICTLHTQRIGLAR